MVIDDSKPAPSAVRSKLREWEDYNLAMRLQDREFDIHYDHNRSERRVVGSDTKQSKNEQQREDETARAMRRAANRAIEETDEQMAQRMAREWHSEEQRKIEEKLRQELIDEQLARRLAEAAEIGSTSSTPVQPEATVFPESAGNLLIDFSSPVASSSHQQPQLGYQTPQSSGSRGIPLPGLAVPTSAVPPPAPPSYVPPQEVPAESPVFWPPPPPSVLQPTTAPPSVANPNIQLSSNNPFLVDLMSTNNVPQPSVVPSVAPSVTAAPFIGFRSEFGLPPPSSLALGMSGNPPPYYPPQQ